MHTSPSRSRRRLLTTLVATAALTLGATGVAEAAVHVAPPSPAPAVAMPAPWETVATLPDSRPEVDVATYLATH
jgi:hypothetical protein